MKSNRGSALLVAIVLSAILLAALAALLTVALNEYRGSHKSYFDTAAFSLAESGIDRAAAFIAAKGMDSAVSVEPKNVVSEAGVWYAKKSGAAIVHYRGYFPQVDLGNNRKGFCSVIVEPGVVAGAKTTYSVYARGIVNGAGGAATIESQRAIHVELTSSTTSSGGAGAAVAAKRTLKFGMGANENPFDQPNRKARLLVASYDSKKNDGRADMTVDLYTGLITGTNFGDSAMVGLKEINGTATLWGALIYGTVAVGGAPSTLNVAANPKAGASLTEWPSQNYYACNVVDLAAAKKYRDEDKAGGYNPYMGFNMDLAASGGTQAGRPLGDNVVYNYTFQDDLFALSGFNTDAQGNYTTFDTSGYLAVGAINGNNNKPLDAMNASTTKTVLGPAAYKAGDGTKTVAYLQSVAGLGEIVVKGQAVLILSGGANLQNGDGVKLSFVDNVSSLKIIFADSNTYDIKFANADNNIADKENLQTSSENRSGVGYSPDRLEILSSQAANFNMRIGAQKDVAAIVKIPNGKVSVDCQDQNKSHQFRGQLIADMIELLGTTYLDIFYDINLGGGGGTKPVLVLASWKQILPSVFAAQL